MSTNCAHIHLPLVGSWWNISPAFLILWIPGGFRATCYYYRKAYYRSFFLSTPACAVRDASKSYSGETRFPFLFQNVHRYFFYLSFVVLAFLWWDVFEAFRFPDGFGLGMGTFLCFIMARCCSFFSISCISCRHFCGGYWIRFHAGPTNFRLGGLFTGLTERTWNWAWVG